MESILDRNEMEELCHEQLDDTVRLILRQAGMLEDVPRELGGAAVEAVVFPSSHQGFVKIIGLE